jgi:hypothetical protein
MSDNTQGCSGNGRAISDRLRMLLALEEAYTARRVIMLRQVVARHLQSVGQRLGDESQVHR